MQNKTIQLKDNFDRGYRITLKTQPIIDPIKYAMNSLLYNW